jgi:hypothetical protein
MPIIGGTDVPRSPESMTVLWFFWNISHSPLPIGELTVSYVQRYSIRINGCRKHGACLYQSYNSLGNKLMNYRLIAGLLALGLMASANGEEGKLPANLLKPTAAQSSWRFEEIEGGKGNIAVDGDTIVFKVNQVDGVVWHVQVFQYDLDMKDNETYTVRFQAKASNDRNVILVAMIDEDDWHEIGLHEDLPLTPKYQTFEFTFRATDTVRKKNRIGFMLGDNAGTVSIKEMTLSPR